MKKELVTKLEDEAERCIEKAVSLPIGENARKQEIENATKIVEVLNAIDQTTHKSEDDQDRITLEQKRIQTTNEVELQKCKRKAGDYALEIFKVVVPIVITCAAYGVFQERLLVFEKDGRVVSTAGRELHLPNLFRI